MTQPDPIRQPVSVLYAGAPRFKADLQSKLGVIARAAFAEQMPNPAALAVLLDIPADALAERVHRAVERKLQIEPIEDFRIDFEDGYGSATDADEDAEADRCGRELSQVALPFIGLRVRSLEDHRDRAIRTLGRFLAACRELPKNFVVTLPKITRPDTVRDAAAICTAMEKEYSLPSGSLRLELMVEHPRAVVDADGRNALPDLVRAGQGRVRGLHLGAYDLLASLGVPIRAQTLLHPHCDAVRSAMVLSDTGCMLSDGAVTQLPLGPDRGSALRHSARAITRAMNAGIAQGWDLHPAQLPIRYAATFAVLLDGIDEVIARARAFADRPTHRAGEFDDMATVRGLLATVRKAVDSGALAESPL